MRLGNARTHVALMAIVLLVGAGLRLAHYFSNRSLWWDEACLAINIIHKTPQELLGRLDYGQAAPAGFLLLSKVLVQLFGSNEFVLRLIPLLGGLLSLVLFAALAQALCGRTVALLALGLFALADPLVYYSSEVKQYSTDVLVALTLLLATVRVKSALTPGSSERSRTTALFFLFGLLGATAVWLSHPSVFVLLGIGFGLAAGAWFRGNRMGAAQLLLPGTMWVFSFAAFYYVSLRHASDSTYLVEFWSGEGKHIGAPVEGAFMPLPPTSASDIAWFVHKFFEVFESPAGMRLTGLAAFSFIVGCGKFLAEKKEWLFILIGPLLAALLASAFLKYPFYKRMLLFAAPALILLTSAGVIQVREKTKESAPLIGFALIALLVSSPVFHAARKLANPVTRAEVKAALNYVVEHRRPEDALYVYYGGETQIRYYAPRYGLEPESYIIGESSRGDWEGYRRDLERVRSAERVWLLFSHSLPAEEAFMLNHMDHMGTRLDQITGTGASAYLYAIDR